MRRRIQWVVLTLLLSVAATIHGVRSTDGIGSPAGINGLWLNGHGWNGIGWTGTSWTGLGWNGSGWSGIGWTGSAWSGDGWGGIRSAADCTPTKRDKQSCTTLHDWVNHTDVDGNGVSGETADRRARVQALSFFVSCACASDVAIPFRDTHGLLQTTFLGELGLAPTWCGGNASAVVPESEGQIVSACMMARVNTRGKQFPIALASYEASTARSTNELLTFGPDRAAYFGDLWKQPHADDDRTTPIDTDLRISGGPWWNMERFSCSFPSRPVVDALAYAGRACDESDCGGELEFIGECASGKKRLGAPAAYDPLQPSAIYYKAVATLGDDPTILGGHTFDEARTGATGGTSILNSYYRGNPWRAILVSTPRMIGFEHPESAPPSSPANGWAQVQSGTIPQQQIAVCAGGLAECERGEKLLGLTSTQAITVNLTGNLAVPDTREGDPNEPVTVAVRYSWPFLLGAGQCDPDLGCENTPSSECASGNAGTAGCVGGTSRRGRLRMWIDNNTTTSSGFTYVHGQLPAAPYGKRVFIPTYSSNKYSTAYIYPVYPQDSALQIAGYSDNTGGPTYDTLRLSVAGETANAADAPQLDAAYFFAGIPPAGADCKGPGGCWLFAGPYRMVSLAQNQTYSYQSPTLPAGSYTFQITNVSGDIDLYVNANAAATTTSWTCRPFLAGASSETCTVALNRPGYFSVLLHGNSPSTSTATFLGRN